ncbi:hypothetical protein K504DRAFT_497286 [Pleomassaria siparia CBS 279.74]|uniref:Uncharacterized protein n=1 Tax=Pleomassaria siparia CBS 279.74 TaxID=1314801 RepID=A0A6G1KS18_9PLEO|nr:hypothetical protein K504DRAFT_497286 [Pleomassaria siparia CBS 279.74]
MASDTTSPQPSTCYLLCLPRELRDQIYTYVLYEEDGIIYYRDQKYKSAFTRTKHDRTGINQLQYTCSQLRAETEALEMKLNDVVFLKDAQRHGHGHDEYMERTPAEQFLGFLDMCSEAWRQRLRRVHLQHTGLSLNGCKGNAEYMSSLHLIVYVCQRYPAMLVLWHMDLEDTEHPKRFLVKGLMWAYGCRSQSHLCYWLEQVKMAPAWCSATFYMNVWHASHQQCRHDDTTGRQVPIEAANFRLLPSFEKGWEEGFRRKLLEIEGEEGMEDVVEKRMALAREWSKNGI